MGLFRLLVSGDFGSSYLPSGEFNSIPEAHRHVVSEHISLGGKRWCVEDEGGTIVFACPLYDITVNKLLQDNASSRVFLSTDEKLRKYLNMFFNLMVEK